MLIQAIGLISQIIILVFQGLSEDPTDVASIAGQIKEAFTNIGFVAVCNHGVTKDLVSHCIQLYTAIRTPSINAR